jgi:hypothetical protein
MNNTYRDKILRDKMYRDESNRYKTHPKEFFGGKMRGRQSILTDKRWGNKNIRTKKCESKHTETNYI